jgi:hypothetical protein
VFVPPLQLFKRQITDALGGVGSALATANTVPIILAASAGSQLVSADSPSIASSLTLTLHTIFKSNFKLKYEHHVHHIHGRPPGGLAAHAAPTCCQRRLARV